jgi:acetyl-CoA acetyltransferase
VALVLTGYGSQVDPGLADLVAEDLGAAVDRILGEPDHG